MTSLFVFPPLLKRLAGEFHRPEAVRKSDDCIRDLSSVMIVRSELRSVSESKTSLHDARYARLGG